MNKNSVASSRTRIHTLAVALGLLLGLANAPMYAGSATYTYDGLGRLKTVTYADGSVVNFTLDAAGNRATVSAVPTSPPSGLLNFASVTYSGGEPSAQRSVTVSVSRTNGSYGAIGVTYRTNDGSATSAGGDFTAATGQLSWTNGDTANKTFVVNILDDSLVEGAEYFNLAIDTPTGGASLGTQLTASVNITDDDFPPPGTLQWSASSYAVVENVSGGGVPITVTRVGGSYGAVSVNLSTVAGGTATAGVDYTTVTNAPLSWTNGDTAPKSVNVAILDDSVFDGTKTVNLALSGVSGTTLGSPNTATIAISDNETSFPNVPTNLRTSPPGISLGGSFTVLWDASTGAPVNHYSLNETVSGTPVVVNNYVIASPTTSKAFAKGAGGQEIDYAYKIRACTTSDESSCTAYTAPVYISTCRASGCQ